MAAINNENRRSSLLFIELIILVLFFVVASVVCMNLFMKADKMAEDARTLNEAVVETTSIAETLKSSNGNLSKAGKYLADTSSYKVEDNVLTIYYDHDMNPAAPSDSSFVATVEKTKEKKLRRYSIRITDSQSGSTIYNLDFAAIKRGGKK